MKKNKKRYILKATVADNPNNLKDYFPHQPLDPSVWVMVNLTEPLRFTRKEALVFVKKAGERYVDSRCKYFFAAAAPSLPVFWRPISELLEKKKKEKGYYLREGGKFNYTGSAHLFSSRNGPKRIPSKKDAVMIAKSNKAHLLENHVEFPPNIYEIRHGKNGKWKTLELEQPNPADELPEYDVLPLFDVNGAEINMGDSFKTIHGISLDAPFTILPGDEGEPWVFDRSGKPRAKVGDNGWNPPATQLKKIEPVVVPEIPAKLPMPSGAVQVKACNLDAIHDFFGGRAYLIRFRDFLIDTIEIYIGNVRHVINRDEWVFDTPHERGDIGHELDADFRAKYEAKK